MSEHVATSGQQTRQQLLNLVDRLIAEFPNQPAGVVIAQVALAKERHRRTDHRDRRELVAVVEHAARQRILSAPSGIDYAPQTTALNADQRESRSRRTFA